MSGWATEDYYLRRERAERALAVKAVDPDAARIHLDLAARYADQAAAAARGQRPKLHVAGF